MRKTLWILIIAPFFYINVSCSDSKNEDDGTTPPVGITKVKPTTELGKATDDVGNLQLKPGKLVSLIQVNEANCKRAVAADMCLDVIVSDEIMSQQDMTDEKLEQMFSTSGSALTKTNAEIWGMHLPYAAYDISAINENLRGAAVQKLKGLIDICLKYLKPKHFVVHPSTGVILTTSSDFNSRKAQSQKSLKELQAYLTERNSFYKTGAILCVENCAKSVGYDGPSLLSLLSGEGLEGVRICLDTGHALIPSTGEYMDPVKNGDALETLKIIGTRLGTLHIQQNVGAEGQTGTLDKHLEPFDGGLIDWGAFYYELLKNNRYRGCFLYEVSYVSVYQGEASTIESAKKNYAELMYPTYQAWMKK